MRTDEIDPIVPFKFYANKKEQMLRSIKNMHEKAGLRRFALVSPGLECRLKEYPPLEEFEQLADHILWLKASLQDYDIQIAWWRSPSFKSGPAEYQRITGMDGVCSPISSCPLDPEFKERIARDVALVAERAKPFMIFFEDDWELSNHVGVRFGCFCKLHLEAFAKRCNKYYSREDLQRIFEIESEQHFALRLEWALLSRESLAAAAAHIREKVDVSSPEIPMGLMQPGCADRDGDMTQAVARAFAGVRHRPFARLFGSSYGSDEAASLPENVFHTLYSKQHLPDDFMLYHESDTYPHTRFFMSAGKLRSLIAASFSYGLEDSVFYGTQYLDFPDEEPGYFEMLAGEKKRFSAMRNAVKHSEVSGCGMIYRALGHCRGASGNSWIRILAHHGIPYTAKESQVNMISGTLPKALSDDEIKAFLKRGVFLDGQAAQLLCERGFGPDIGVSVQAQSNFKICGERVRDQFTADNTGQRMYNMAFAPAMAGEGEVFHLVPNDPGCEVITDFLEPDEKPCAAGMTRYENSLGGRVAVSAIAMKNNRSSAVFNYRKQRLLQMLVHWLGKEKAEYVFVRNKPKVFCILNRPQKETGREVLGIVTLINLCSDTFDSVELGLPETWNKRVRIEHLDLEGVWKKVECEWLDQSVNIVAPLALYHPLYLRFMAVR